LRGEKESYIAKISLNKHKIIFIYLFKHLVILFNRFTVTQLQQVLIKLKMRDKKHVTVQIGTTCTYLDNTMILMIVSVIHKDKSERTINETPKCVDRTQVIIQKFHGASTRRSQNNVSEY